MPAVAQPFLSLMEGTLSAEDERICVFSTMELSSSENCCLSVRPSSSKVTSSPLSPETPFWFLHTFSGFEPDMSLPPFGKSKYLRDLSTLNFLPDLGDDGNVKDFLLSSFLAALLA